MERASTSALGNCRNPGAIRPSPDPPTIRICAGLSQPIPCPDYALRPRRGRRLIACCHDVTKILWSQVLLVAAVVLGFVWAVAEWTAWKLGFQSPLGHPWFGVLGWPVYQPPAFFWWWFAYDAYARPIFVEGAYIAASGASPRSSWLSPCRCGARGRSRRSRPTGPCDGQNLARTGAPVCITTTAFYSAAGAARIFDSTARNMYCASRRREAGKGVGLVVPTLLTWPASAIVHDIRGCRFGRVLLFDPTDADSAAYNPLLEVRRGEWEVVDPEGALERPTADRRAGIETPRPSAPARAR